MSHFFGIKRRNNVKQHFKAFQFFHIWNTNLIWKGRKQRNRYLESARNKGGLPNTTVSMSEVASYISSIFSANPSMASSVLSEVNDSTTFTGAFSSYSSDLSSLISDILSNDSILTSSDFTISTVTVSTSTSNAAAGTERVSGFFGVMAVFVASLAAFYAL
jgi:hypothetical protein